jgi:hypothetical protein
MDILDSRNRLVSNEEDSLQRKLSATVVEQILERWAEEVMDEHVEVALLSTPPGLRNSLSAGQRFVRLLLDLEGSGFISNVCELYSDLVAGLKVGSCPG